MGWSGRRGGEVEVPGRLILESGVVGVVKDGVLEAERAGLAFPVVEPSVAFADSAAQGAHRVLGTGTSSVRVAVRVDEGGF